MNRLIYLLSGLLSALLLAASWPTYGIAWISFIAFVPLLWGLSIVSFKPLKKLSIWFSNLLFISIWMFITCFWVRHASWAGLFISVLFASSTMSLSIYCYYISKKTLAPVVFITSWITLEYFHLHADFGMPWMILGNIFSSQTEWIQWYEYTGTLGGSLWILMVNCLAFSTLKDFVSHRKKRGVLKTLYFIILILLPISLSKSLIKVTNYTKNDKAQILLIQPNIDPYREKYMFNNSTLATQLLNTIKPYNLKEIDWVITPETYLSRGLNLDELPLYPTINNLTNSLKDYPNLNLAVGLEAYQIPSDQNSFERVYYNTAVHVGSYNADNLHTYYKSKLLLGVETIPYPKLFKSFESILLDFGGTVSLRGTQKERAVFISKDTTQKMAPIICWEAIFGEFVTDYIKKEANFLGILSNDGWWANSEGHRQLLFYNKLRAIETRRYLVRAVNTGISAVINEIGVIEKQLAYDTKGTIRASIPLLNKVTFYVKYGDYLGRGSIAIALLLFFYQRGLKVFKRKQFFS